GVSVKVSHGVNLAMADNRSSLLSVVQTNQPVPVSASETTHSEVSIDAGKPSHLLKTVRRSVMLARLSLPAAPCLVSQCSTNFIAPPPHVGVKPKHTRQPTGAGVTFWTILNYSGWSLSM